MQQNNQQQSGVWDKFLNQTSKDGFNHQKHRNLSPQNRQQNTQGNWQKFMNKTSITGFDVDHNKYSAKQRATLPIDHFEGGQTIVQVNDEGGLWNRKPLTKHNNAVKTSHVFDSVKYPTSKEEEKQRYQQIHFPETNVRGQIHTQYERYYRQDAAPGQNQKTEYKKFAQSVNNDQNQQNQQQQQDFSQKTQQRKALPTPTYMKQFLQYKKEHDCLNL